MWNISIYTPGVLSLVKAVVFYNWFWLSQDFKTYHQVYEKKPKQITNHQPSTKHPMQVYSVNLCCSGVSLSYLYQGWTLAEQTSSTLEHSVCAVQIQKPAIH